MLDEIDDCRWIHLRELAEPGENALRLVVDEAHVAGPPVDIEVRPAKVLRGLERIESDPSCRVFELVWPTYVCYAVRNESFCTQNADETWEGRLFRRYSKSHFLEFVARTTIATAAFPRPLQHWGVACLDHVIDVVSASAPHVRRMEPAGEAT
jgi:hypothetical protein